MVLEGGEEMFKDDLSGPEEDSYRPPRELSWQDHFMCAPLPCSSCRTQEEMEAYLKHTDDLWFSEDLPPPARDRIGTGWHLDPSQRARECQ